MPSDSNTESARVAAYYNAHPETDRLRRSIGKLEFERTKEIISRHLRSPARILDVGGGTGAYSFWLASLGHQVTLVDVCSAHIEAVSKENERDHRLAAVVEASAVELPFAEKRFDVVLNMGPMYHLSPELRGRALREARRVLQPKGLMITTYISRFASLMDGYNEGYVKDPVYLPMALGAALKGRHDPPGDGRHFTLAYMHRPEEVGPELEEGGFQVIELCAVEGFFWAHPRVEEYIADDGDLAELMKTVKLLEKEPSVMGASAHFLAVSKPKQESAA